MPSKFIQQLYSPVFFTSPVKAFVIPGLSVLNNWTNGWGPDCDTDAGMRDMSDMALCLMEATFCKVSSGRQETDKQTCTVPETD